MSGDELPNKITAMLMIEVLGRPKEHLVETLQDMIKRIGEEKGAKVIDSKIKEPTLVKDQKDLFTTFAEIEVEVNDFSALSILMFKYMPAHIDVIEPENIRISNNVLSDVMSELTRRLHGYDEMARVMQNQQKILENQLRKLEEEKK